MAGETFREFFERRHGIPFPAKEYELAEVVLKRLADTMADWADELAKRVEKATDGDS